MNGNGKYISKEGPYNPVGFPHRLNEEYVVEPGFTITGRCMKIEDCGALILEGDSQLILWNHPCWVEEPC